MLSPVAETNTQDSLDLLQTDLSCRGSLNPERDFQAVMAHKGARSLASVELYRVLMEPVLGYQEEDWRVAVTVFRPLRDMKAAEVYNWMLYFGCLDVDYEEIEDVSLVLGTAKDHWRIHKSDLRGSRLFLTPNKDRLFQEASSGAMSLEYVTIPDSLLPADVIRTGYMSATIRAVDLVIAWNFPEDPVRSWHEGRRMATP